MQAVLGIDAAWTLTQPSGFAAAVRSGSSWRLCGVADSYQRFYCLTDSRLAPEMKPSGSAVNAAQLLATACQLCRASIELVAVDMPLARTPIRGRRASDNAVSRAYGARQCGTQKVLQVMPAWNKPHRASLSSSAAAHLDELLDEALEQTFPASDAVAIDIERESQEREARLLDSRAPLAGNRKVGHRTAQKH